jgi:hypothetical protein
VFSLVRAPRFASSCARCRAPLAARAWVVSRANGPLLYHPRCALDVDLVATFELLSRNAEAFTDRPEVQRVLDERMRAVAVRAAIARGEAVDASAEVEPARDHLGRPRVRVALVGSAATRVGPLHAIAGARDSELSFASSLREYCFAPFEPDRPASVEDPSQPLVAVVFAALEGVAVLPSERAALLAFNARSLPTPVLWLSSRRRRRARSAVLSRNDDEVRRYRKVLDDCGFSSDEALVVRSLDDDGAALSAVALALDESVVSLGRSPLDTRSPIERSCAQIHELIDLERDVGLRQVLWQVYDLLPQASEAEAALIGEVATRALPLRVGSAAALAMLEELPSFDAREALSRWVLDVAESEREPDSLYVRCVTLLRERWPETLVSLLERIVADDSLGDRLRRLFERERAHALTRIVRRAQQAHKSQRK